MWVLVMKPEYAEKFDGKTPLTKILTIEDSIDAWTDERSSILPALSFNGSYQK